MSEIKLSCPGCHQHLKLPEEYIGQPGGYLSVRDEARLPECITGTWQVAGVGEAPNVRCSASLEARPAPEKDGKFVDSSFAPSADSLGDKKLAGKVGCWVRAPLLLSAPRLYSGIEPGDIVQGSVGDCWLMASLACVAE